MGKPFFYLFLVLNIPLLTFQNVAIGKDIRSKNKKFPGRYIGTPIFEKKNSWGGSEFMIQFQDCKVSQVGDKYFSDCKPILEAPLDAISDYIYCATDTYIDKGSKYLSASILSGLIATYATGATVASGGTSSAVSVPLAVGAGIVSFGAGKMFSHYDDKRRDFEDSYNEFNLAAGIDHESSKSVEELVNNFRGLYSKMYQSKDPVDFENCVREDLSKYHAYKSYKDKTKSFGLDEPKKRIEITKEKFAWVNHAPTEAKQKPAEKIPSTGTGNNKQQETAIAD